MIKVIHIAPTANMLEVDTKYNNGLNMILTHLVLNDKKYREVAAKLPGVKYLDNSFFELGYCLKPDDMVKAAKMVDATVLICPDGTLDGADYFRSEGYKVMAIPKTPEQFVEFMNDKNIHLVGVSEEHLDYRHSPGARYELFRDYIEPMMPKNKIHLLGGTDSIWELGMLKPFDAYIESWDSSAAIWQGHLGHDLSNIARKDTTSVDFNANVNLYSLTVVKNIDFIASLTGGKHATSI